MALAECARWCLAIWGILSVMKTNISRWILEALLMVFSAMFLDGGEALITTTASIALLETLILLLRLVPCLPSAAGVAELLAQPWVPLAAVFAGFSLGLLVRLH